MRGYYYDQTGEAPRSTPAPIFAGRRRRWSGAAAVLLFLLTMALLGGLTAAAGLWSHSRLEELPALADSTWQPLPVREELPEETTVERAPTGDGTTLTISPLPSGGAHSLQEIYRENIASIVSIRGSKGDGMSLGISSPTATSLRDAAPWMWCSRMSGCSRPCWWDRMHRAIWRC